jgi:hypothetical protein
VLLKACCSRPNLILDVELLEALLCRWNLSKPSYIYRGVLCLVIADYTVGQPLELVPSFALLVLVEESGCVAHRALRCPVIDTD